MYERCEAEMGRRRCNFPKGHRTAHDFTTRCPRCGDPMRYDYEVGSSAEGTYWCPCSAYAERMRDAAKAVRDLGSKAIGDADRACLVGMLQRIADKIDPPGPHVRPRDDGPLSLYCYDCETWVPNTANAEMRKEGEWAHSHQCSRP